MCVIHGKTRGTYFEKQMNIDYIAQTNCFQFLFTVSKTISERNKFVYSGQFNYSLKQ